MPISVEKTSFLPASYDSQPKTVSRPSLDSVADDDDISMPGSPVDSAVQEALPEEKIRENTQLPNGEFENTRELSHLYRVTTKQGDGGCSVVYDAWRIADGAHVALKVLALSPTLDPEDAERTRQRFFAEAQVLTTFVDDHIVKCLNYGLFNGAPCAVLEFISGKQLDVYIREFGMLPYEYAIGIIRQILLALEEAHSKGVIHRDLKPANILIIREVEPPTVKLIDFGIATFTESTQTSLQKTPSGIIRGTPSYMAPELFSGTESASVESDLYAIGLILCECLTGKVAYSAPSLMQVAYKQVNEPLTLPVFIPQCLNHVIRKCCEKDRTKRYHSARELIHALDNALPMALAMKERSEENYLKSLEEAKAQTKPKQNNLTVIIAVAACVIAVISIVLVFLFQPRTSEQPPVPNQATAPDAKAPSEQSKAADDTQAPAELPKATDDTQAPAEQPKATEAAPKPKSTTPAKSKSSKPKSSKTENKESSSDKGTTSGKKADTTYVPTSIF